MTSYTTNSSSLYVGDLHKEVTEAFLFESFREIGPIMSIKVCRDAVTLKSLGYAYVNFQTPQDAAKAIEQLNYTQLKGKPIRIMYVQRDPSIRKSGVGNIFIKNLHVSIDNKSLYDTFSLFGNILSCKVCTRKVEKIGKDGKPFLEETSLGYGFVHFDTQKAAEMAIQKVDGMLIGGQQVKVSPFLKKIERTKGVQEVYSNLYIKDLDFSVDEKKIKKSFEQFGEISSCVLLTDEKGRKFAFLSYSNPDYAKKAVDSFCNKEVEGLTPKGKVIYVGKAEKKENRAQKLREEFEKKKQENIQKFQGLNLYVKNLEDSWDDKKLNELFSPFGKITSCCVMKDGQTSSSKCFGFVCYSLPEEASKAITEMHNKMLGQKPLFVTLAQRKEQRRQELEQQMLYRHTIRSSIPMNPQMYGQVIYQPNMNQRNNLFQSTKPRWVKENRNPSQNKGKRGQSRSTEEGQRQDRSKTGRGGKQTIGEGRDVKFNSNVKNKNPPKQTKLKQTQIQMQPGLNSEYLASLSPSSQKQVLGESLFPLVQAYQPELASKITGMFLEMDNGEILHLLETPNDLKAKITEAETVLKIHAEKL